MPTQRRFKAALEAYQERELPRLKDEVSTPIKALLYVADPFLASWPSLATIQSTLVLIDRR